MTKGGAILSVSQFIGHGHASVAFFCRVVAAALAALGAVALSAAAVPAYAQAAAGPWPALLAREFNRLQTGVALPVPRQGTLRATAGSPTSPHRKRVERHARVGIWFGTGARCARQDRSLL